MPVRHEPSVKKANFPMNLDVRRGIMKGDSMPDAQTALVSPTPSIVPSDIPALSDDECLVRLAQAVEERDSGDLDEVARLIGRLAVTIE
jgi:hypothetical protein